MILEIVGQFQEGETRIVARLGLNGHHAHERSKGAELDERHLRIDSAGTNRGCKRRVIMEADVMGSRRYQVK